jgi:dodecin
MSDVQTFWVETDDADAWITDALVEDQTCPTYRLTEIVGTSPEGIDQAISNGLAKASRSLHGLGWFQVDEIRGSIANGKPQSFQVRMRVGFRVDG